MQPGFVFSVICRKYEARFLFGHILEILLGDYNHKKDTTRVSKFKTILQMTRWNRYEICHNYTIDIRKSNAFEKEKLRNF